MSIYIAYHEIAPTVPCADGLTSAWVAKRKFPEAILKGAIYQHEPSLPTYCQPGDKIYILDFSFDGEVLKELSDRGVEVRLIDHHKSAFNRITSFESQMFRYKFEIGRAGCELTWETFFPNEPLPEFLKYVGANDTRSKFYYDNWRTCKIITSAIWEMGHNFQTYDMLYALNDELDDFLITPENVAVFEERQEIIRSMFDRIYFDEFYGYQNIPHLELKTKEWKYRSDVPEVYLMENDYPFFVIHDKKRKKHSLRSYPFGKSSVMVDGVAESFGGGGHAWASGFQI